MVKSIESACLPRVVIFGAKPGSNLPRGLHLYTANGAEPPPGNVLDSFETRSVVASSLVMGKGLRPGVENHDVYKLKLRNIVAPWVQKLVLMSDPGGWDLAASIRAFVRAERPSIEIEEISVRARRELVREVAQLRYPVVDARFRTQPLRVRLRDRLEFARRQLEWAFGNNQRDVRAKYRPSTGILSLLVAISRHGASAEYVISGIGLRDRQKFELSGQKGWLQPSAFDALPKHLVADELVLRNLSARYRILTVEPELSALLDLDEPGHARTSE